MLFKYKAIDSSGKEREGDIDAINIDVAIGSLQRRGLVISSINPAEETSFFETKFALFESVSNRDIVILSRQIATLFEAQVSALRVFRLLAGETPNPILQKHLTEVSDDLQGGTSISNALSKHSKIFSAFYVNMVRAGEEAGKLDETFLYLAEHLDRQYEVTSKARNSLIYPAFVIFTFIVVMILMLTLVIPRISTILLESGQDIPIYTKVVIGISNFFIDFGVFLLVMLIVAGFLLWRFLTTERGRTSVARFQLGIPYVGNLYTKLYLSRIASNLSTMLSSGIPIIRALEITGSVVGNVVYKDLLEEASQAVKGGSAVSEALNPYPEIPGIMIQMIKVGEETGEVGNILQTLSKFYQREVTNAVDTLVNLIEPVMIVVLGVGVGLLLTSVLLPIYNISAGI